MRLHFVAPARSKTDYLFGKETFPPLGFMSLAAYTPRHVEVHVLNVNLEPIDFSDIPDLVGITTMTARASRRPLGENRVEPKFRHTPCWESRPSWLTDQASRGSYLHLMGQEGHTLGKESNRHG